MVESGSIGRERAAKAFDDYGPSRNQASTLPVPVDRFRETRFSFLVAVQALPACSPEEMQALATSGRTPLACQYLAASRLSCSH